MARRVLFVLTSVDKTLSGVETGWFLPEAAHPYYLLSSKYEIDFAAPKGPNPQVDPRSVQLFKDDESVNFLKDEKVKVKLVNAKYLTEVKADDYDAIFYVGGYGPVIDLAGDPNNIELAEAFWNQGKIVSAVCHGPGALVNVSDSTGNNIFAGKELTGISNAEQEWAGQINDVPFLLETEITSKGGKYSKASEPWAPWVVKSGKLITGQNPASAKPIGEALLQALESTV